MTSRVRTAALVALVAVLFPLATVGVDPSPAAVTPDAVTSVVPEPGPLANVDRPLTTTELAALQARSLGSSAVVTVVATASIARDIPIRARRCTREMARTQGCTFGVLYPAPGDTRLLVVDATPGVAARFPDDDSPVAGSLAFVVSGGRIRLLGAVDVPAGTYRTPVEETAISAADVLPMGRLIAVEGWLGVLGWGLPCPLPPGVLGRQGMASPFVRCPGGWITADGVLPDDSADIVHTSPPGFGIPVQAEAYERFAPDPAPAVRWATPPRRGVYLLRQVKNPDPDVGDRRGWLVIGRLDPLDPEAQAGEPVAERRRRRPMRRSVTVEEGGVRVSLTLRRNPLVAGEPVWLRTKVRNLRDGPIVWSHDGCATSVYVSGKMTDQTWRPFALVDREPPRAESGAYLEPINDLRWYVQASSTAASPTIRLDFEPESGIGPRGGCADVGLERVIPPGGVIVQRWRWDGTVFDRLGPPPSGPARITGLFYYQLPHEERHYRTVRASLDTWVNRGRDPRWLQPMEAVDAAVADPDFVALMEPIALGHDTIGYVVFDPEREVWVVGACGWFDGRRVYYKVAVIDPLSGEATELIDGPGGETCEAGPWA